MNIFHVNNRWGALCLSQGRRMGYPACSKYDTGISWTVVSWGHDQTSCLVQPTVTVTPWRAEEPVLHKMITSSNGNILRVTGHLCGEFVRSPVNSPHKDQWRGTLMFSLICIRINCWVNNCEAGDLRRHRAHYDVIVMIFMNTTSFFWRILMWVKIL